MPRKLLIYKISFLLLLILMAIVPVDAQQELGDCTIHYSVRFKKDSTLLRALKTVYVHGAKVRIDFSYENYLQTIIADHQSGSVQVMKEIGRDKYRTVLDSVQWENCNALYRNAQTTIEEETSVILGYRCGKALLTLSNGSKYYVYYTLDVIPSAKENAYQFKDIPGIILRYESVADPHTAPIEITARSINLMPLSSHLFQPPSKGYKLLRNFSF